VVASSFLANLVCLALATQIPARAGWPLTAAAFYLVGLAVGCAHGAMISRASILAVAAGALGAALVLSTPLILVTYGFALLGTPLVIGYVLVVAAGTYLGMRIRRYLAKPQ
jgi:NhaP-type Na+/H+ or K+/H+ antiporter